MGLQGQVERREAGYAMAAMLVTIAVMSVMLTVALPAWRQMVQREKEEELIFRGQQYARSIGLFQRKYAAAYPPDIDTLVRQKFLRKKYKDPMSPDGEFQVLYQSSLGQSLQAGRRGQRGGRQAEGAQGRQQQDQQEPGLRLPGSQPFFTPRGAGSLGTLGGTVGPRGGVIGVVSKSTDTSIRLYNGRNHYNEWQFVFAPSLFGPGGARPGMRPGQLRPGQRPGQGRPGFRFGEPGRRGSSPGDSTPTPRQNPTFFRPDQ